MDLVTRTLRTQFLGREFLTWVWYRTVRDDHAPAFTHEGRPIEIDFDARITLESPGDTKEQSVVKSETPTETDEAYAALQTGKLVRDAKMRLRDDQKEWSLSLRGDNLSLHGVKVPGLLERDEADQVVERLRLLAECEDLIDALFGQFLNARLNDEAWRTQTAAMREWVFAEHSDE